jgi:UDP-4-amino-4,6-dideoxy-N-acetyl-beta-L-altrosamine transaminase
MIPYGRQDITQADLDAVATVLRSDFLTQGPAVPAFEAAVATVANAAYAVAVNSATSALHIACAALDLGPGDVLWTVPNTFVASANCGRYCGADVDFVDIDPQSWNMSVERLEEKLIAAKAAGRLPKIVVPVHLCGQSCDMVAISGLAREYGFRVIEDASHAIGGRFRDAPVGNCAHSDITIFSFHPVKIVTTAEGGMAVTNNPDLAKRMARLRTHGITRDPDEMTQVPDGPWYYQQIELGWNYRMTDMQAALGLSQLDRLHSYVARRHDIARRYDTELADLPLTRPWHHPDSYSALHLYPVRLHDTALHRTTFEALRSAGIGVNLHYIPLHLQPYYRALGFREGDFPESEAYYRSAISLPIFPTMTDDQQSSVIAALRHLLS